MVRAIRRLSFTSILISSLILSLTSSLGCGLTKNAEPADPEDGGERIVPPCGHLASHYRVTPAVACESTPFVCPADQGAFVDTCGCGCTWPGDVRPYPIPVPPPNPERGPGEPSECGGPAGPFARFESDTRRIVIGEDAVFVFVPMKPISSWAMDAGADDIVWRVDKKSKGLTVFLDSSRAVAEMAPEGVLASTKDCRSPLVIGAYSYACTLGKVGESHTRFQRTPIAGGPSEVLFEVPEEAAPESGFVVDGADFYAVTRWGALWHASVLPGGAALTILEQRGVFDDDDYWALLGVDHDAVYWQAGLDPDRYTSDSETLTLFRKCRTSP